MDAGSSSALLLRANGTVLGIIDDGRVNEGSHGPPADLGPAIRVEVAGPIHAVQKPDGSWAAWTPWVGEELTQLARAIPSLGPVLDLDADTFSVADQKSAYVLYIQPAEEPAVAGLTNSKETAVPGSAGTKETSAPPADELTARLADIHAKFQAAYDRDIAPPHAATVATLDNNYLNAVNRALDAASKRADLDEAVAFREEAKRVTNKQPMPAEDVESTPPALKNLRATYRATLASLEKDRDAKAKPYFDRYDVLLEEYQKELTQQGRLDDALKIKTRREELRTNGDGSSSVQAPAPSPAVATSAPANADPAGQDKLIDWVFSRKGEVTVRVGNQVSRTRIARELPNKPYDLTEINVGGSGISDRELAAVAGVPALRTVQINGNHEFSTLKHFASLVNLQFLSIEGTPIKESELSHLSGLMALEYLTLEFKSGTGEGMAHLRGHAKLKSIKLVGVNLSDSGAQAIAAIPHLTSINLDRFIHRKSQSHLAALAALPELARLSLTHSELGEEAFTAFATMKKLSHLNLSDSEFDNAGFAHLGPLAETLKNLDMQWGATASDEGLAHIAAKLPNLEAITVSTGATCTDKGIRELAKLPKLKSISWWVKGMKAKDYQALADLPAIERIILNNTEITDEGLSAFPKSQTLKILNLDNNTITDKGLAHLQAIPHLTELVLRSTKVTAAGFAAFQKARPEVKVTK